LFIVFEGIDGSGKSTQARLLYQYMKKKRECVLTDEPSTLVIGNLIKRILRKHIKVPSRTLQLLYVADRGVHTEDLINPALTSGKVVIADRYSASTAAFGYAGGLDMKWIVGLNSVFPEPDVIFFIDVDPKIAMERASKKRIEHSVPRYSGQEYEFLTKVREGYKKLKKFYPNYHIIDGARGKNEIASEILDIVKRLKTQSNLKNFINNE